MEPILYELCKQKLTLVHFLLDCFVFNETHRRRNNMPHSIEEALKNNQINLHNVSKYLQDSDILLKVYFISHV